MEYLTQIDCTWLATDAQGRLAAMITAGEGPIPAIVLNRSLDITTIEEALLNMPIVGDATVVVDVPNPSSFIDLSRRGMFVYDWTDVHKTCAQAQGAYELAAFPSIAIKLDDLPTNLHEIPSMILNGGEIGADNLKID